MTPQTQPPQLGQEAAVAVLQTTTTHLEQRISELVKNHSDGMALIGTKLDEIARQSTLLATLQAEQTNHSTGLARAFERLDAQDRRLLDIDKKAASARGGLFMLSAISGVVLALATIFVAPIVNQAYENTKEIQRLEVELEKLKVVGDTQREVRNEMADREAGADADAR